MLRFSAPSFCVGRVASFASLPFRQEDKQPLRLDQKLGRTTWRFKPTQTLSRIVSYIFPSASQDLYFKKHNLWQRLLKDAFPSLAITVGMVATDGVPLLGLLYAGGRQVLNLLEITDNKYEQSLTYDDLESFKTLDSDLYFNFVATAKPEVFEPDSSQIKYHWNLDPHKIQRLVGRFFYKVTHPRRRYDLRQVNRRAVCTP